MAITSSQRVVRRRFDSPEQEAYLALWRTYDRLRLLEDELFVEFELTAQQYNLLRPSGSCRALRTLLACSTGSRSAD
jgi:hypothetical protein